MPLYTVFFFFESFHYFHVIVLVTAKTINGHNHWLLSKSMVKLIKNHYNDPTCGHPHQLCRCHDYHPHGSHLAFILNHG